jgi:hypothetical protein
VRPKAFKLIDGKKAKRLRPFFDDVIFWNAPGFGCFLSFCWEFSFDWKQLNLIGVLCERLKIED